MSKQYCKHDMWHMWFMSRHGFDYCPVHLGSPAGHDFGPLLDMTFLDGGAANGWSLDELFGDASRKGKHMETQRMKFDGVHWVPIIMFHPLHPKVEIPLRSWAMQNRRCPWVVMGHVPRAVLWPCLSCSATEPLIASPAQLWLKTLAHLTEVKCLGKESQRILMA